jgi:hypothetical protein
MKNLILSALSAGLLFASAPATPASAAIAADINLHFGGAPNVYFARQPRTILIPDTQVYYVEGTDYDMFQCDGMWYVDDGGNWFEASSYRGPFEPVDYYNVPTVIMNIPSAYAHQPYRPGMWRSDARSYGYGGGASYRSGRSYNRSWQSSDNRNWQDSNQRWQQQQRQGWQQTQPPQQPRQGWQQSGQNTRRNQGWQQSGQGNSQGNGQDNGNHGNGHGRGNGNGHGRGHGNGRDGN